MTSRTYPTLRTDPTSDRTVLFHRDFRGFTGGHLKVWHYFRHFLAIPGFRPRIYFTPESVWDEDNPWATTRAHVVDRWAPDEADMLFVAGLDWLALEEYPRIEHDIPVVNLLQGLRHCDPADPYFAFLARPALRICVSAQVAAAVRATKRCNGPVVTIENKLDHSELPEPRHCHARDFDVFIDGIKNNDMGRRLAAHLAERGIRVKLLLARCQRRLYLEMLNRSSIVVLLPWYAEGFYLPALEAMALKCFVICPDCQGNRSFCIDGRNCLRPHYTETAIADAVGFALRLTEAQRKSIIGHGYKTACHGLKEERGALADALSRHMDCGRQ